MKSIKSQKRERERKGIQKEAQFFMATNRYSGARGRKELGGYYVTVLSSLSRSSVERKRAGERGGGGGGKGAVPIIVR